MNRFLGTEGLDWYLHSNTYEGPVSVPRNGGVLTNWMMGDRRSGSIEDRFTVQEAIDWIRKVDDEPFFLYLNLQSSHLPFEIPADFNAPFEPPEKIRGMSIEGTTIKIVGKEGGGFKEISETLWIRYLNSLAYIDHLLSDLFAELESSGQMDETIIVLLADTGFSFYEHGSWGYGSVPWEQAVNVPLIIRTPESDGSDDHGIAEMVDVAPTLLSLLDLPPYEGFQGEDLTSVPPKERSPAFITTQTPISSASAVVHNQWKYIYDMDSRRPMLFKLSSDPSERDNLVQEHPEMFFRLDTLLGLWRRAQINYYQEEQIHAREFPPRFKPNLDLEALARANRKAR